MPNFSPARSALQLALATQRITGATLAVSGGTQIAVPTSPRPHSVQLYGDGNFRFAFDTSATASNAAYAFGSVWMTYALFPDAGTIYFNVASGTTNVYVNWIYAGTS